MTPRCRADTTSLSKFLYVHFSTIAMYINLKEGCGGRAKLSYGKCPTIPTPSYAYVRITIYIGKDSFTFKIAYLHKCKLCEYCIENKSSKFTLIFNLNKAYLYVTHITIAP